MSEHGFIAIEGARFEVEKQGIWSGEWHIKSEGAVLYQAVKANPFTRHFEITGPEGTTILKAPGLGRSMILSGPETHLTLSPNHPFTRKATIKGSGHDFTGVSFAFWLTILTWKRSSQRASSQGGGAT